MPSTRPPIVASPTVAPLLTARAAGAATALVSLDLGLTHSVATLGDSGVTLPDGHVFAWADVEHVAQDEASHVEGHCFVLHEGGLERVQIFSRAFNRLYSLVATRTAPTLLISGIPMHRIKESDPRRDTI